MKKPRGLGRGAFDLSTMAIVLGRAPAPAWRVIIMVILIIAGARTAAPIRGSAVNGAVTDEVGLMAGSVSCAASIADRRRFRILK